MLRVKGYVVGYSEKDGSLIWTVKVKDESSSENGNKFPVYSLHPGTMLCKPGVDVTFEIKPVGAGLMRIMSAVDVAEIANPAGSYFRGEKMQGLVDFLKARGLVKRLTNGKPCHWADSSRYEFKVTGRGEYEQTEYARDPEVDVLMSYDLNVVRPAVMEYARALIKQETCGSWHNISSILRDHVQKNPGHDLDLHEKLVAILLSVGSELAEEDEYICPFIADGNYARIGDLRGPVYVTGNVRDIGGRLGPKLVIGGDVESISYGMFRGDCSEPITEESYVLIHGNVKGYKTGIRNPNLTIEIRGSVLNPTGAFIYQGSDFKRMIVHGDLLSPQSVCPGLMSGTLEIHGHAPFLVDYLKKGHKNTSAASYGHGNVILQGKYVLKDGKVVV